jgi:ribosomal protein L37E
MKYKYNPNTEDEYESKESNNKKVITCNSCGNNKFMLLEGVYNASNVPEPHFEVVCSKCGYGMVMRFTIKSMTLFKKDFAGEKKEEWSRDLLEKDLL